MKRRNFLQSLIGMVVALPVVPFLKPEPNMEAVSAMPYLGLDPNAEYIKVWSNVPYIRLLETDNFNEVVPDWRTTNHSHLFDSDGNRLD